MKPAPSRPVRRTTQIKVCGITSLSMAQAAVEAGADAIGLVIGVARSPRNLTVEQAKAIARGLPRRVLTIAVVQDPDPDLADRWDGTWIQLHGNEDEEMVARFARTKHVVRGFRFDPDEVMRWNDCPHVDSLLVDGSTGGEGGSFDHAALAEMMPRIAKPVLIAGGLRPDTVAAAIQTVRPFGVDVSSGVESSPGVKDPQLIRRFCEAVAQADIQEGTV